MEWNAYCCLFNQVYLFEGFFFKGKGNNRSCAQAWSSLLFQLLICCVDLQFGYNTGTSLNHASENQIGN